MSAVMPVSYGKDFDLTIRDRLAHAVTQIEKLPQVEVPLQHYFAHGVYARHGFIEKGTMFAGRVHLQSQINIISRGDVTVLTNEGLMRIKGPAIWQSPPGAQRAAYAHEDTIWTTILGTHETDPDVIFEKYTKRTYEEAVLAFDEVMKIVKE